jgi:hypothetical protein
MCKLRRREGSFLKHHKLVNVTSFISMLPKLTKLGCIGVYLPISIKRSTENKPVKVTLHASQSRGALRRSDSFPYDSVCNNGDLQRTFAGKGARPNIGACDPSCMWKSLSIVKHELKRRPIGRHCSE